MRDPCGPVPPGPHECLQSCTLAGHVDAVDLDRVDGSPTVTPLVIGMAGPVDLHRLGPLAGAPLLSAGRRGPMLTDLVLALRERGHALRVFTLSSDLSDVGDHVGERLTVHVRYYRPRRRWIDGFRAERRALVDAMRHDRCDVLHAHWTYEYALAALKADPRHSIVTVRDWGPAVLRRHRHPYRFVRLLMQVVVLLRARRLTANSAYTAAKVARWFRRTVPVIPNGVDVPPSLPARHPRKGLAVGAVNNGFGELKNVRRLLEAFPMVRASRPDAVLRLVGDGYGVGGAAHRWAIEHGLAQGVEFVGRLPREEVMSFMSSIDVLVHPSLEESFGTTIIEAIVQGALVVAGCRSGAVPWVLGHGAAGTLVDVRDPRAIASAVLAVPADEAARDVLRTRALEHVRAHFSLAGMTQRHEELYRDVLEGGAPWGRRRRAPQRS